MTRSLRVLLVPDYIDWILGTWAKQIARLGRAHQYYVFPAGLIAGNRQKWEALMDDIDVVHFLTPYVADYLPEFRARNKRIITSIHHVVDWDTLQPLTDADAIMVVAQEWKEYLLNKGVPDSKIHLFQNGVDPHLFAPLENRRSLKRTFNFDPDRFLLGFFAKYSSNALDRKGIQMLLGALKRLEPKEQFGVVLTGPGWEPVIQALVKANLTVYSFPFLSAHQMPMLYNALDAYLVSANVEGGPAPLLESMACGTPVITTPVGIANDVIQHDVNGMLVAKGDSAALAEAILRLSNSPELLDTLADSALALIRSSLSWDKTLFGIENLYRDVFEAHPVSVNVPHEPRMQAECQRRWAMTVDSYRWHERLLHQGYWLEGVRGLFKNATRDKGRHLYACLKNSYFKNLMLGKIRCLVTSSLKEKKHNQDASLSS